VAGNIKHAITGGIACSSYLTRITLVLDILGKVYVNVLLF
jgi:hypothetical protein